MDVSLNRPYARHPGATARRGRRGGGLRSILIAILAIGLPLLCVFHCTLGDHAHQGHAPAQHPHAHHASHRTAPSVIPPVLERSAAFARPDDAPLGLGAVCHPQHHHTPSAVYASVLPLLARAGTLLISMQILVPWSGSGVSFAPEILDPPPR